MLNRSRDLPTSCLVPWCLCASLLLSVSASQAQEVSSDTPEDQEAIQEDWPQFRGVNASGIGTGDVPTSWDLNTGENILWKRSLQGLSHSCPIVAGDRIFLTTAISDQLVDEDIPTGFLGGTGDPADDGGEWRWQVACFDRLTGNEIWRRSVANGVPTIKRHLKSTHANSTPATDGIHLVAFFGSEGLFCLDMEGNLLWSKQFGRLHSGPYDAPDLEWGFASSPIIHDGKVILQCDCLNTNFVSVLDIETGDEIRRIEREDVATWSTPTIIETESETQLICNGHHQMAGYDLDTGEMLWTLSGGGDVPIPAPLTADGMILIANGHGGSAAFAISPAARGDLTPDKEADTLPDGLLWWEPRGGAYIPTPIIVDDLIYTCTARGVLSVRERLTGELVYQERIDGQYSASAVATKDQLYFAGEDGFVRVVKTGREFEMLGTSELGEPVFATPAIAGDQLLIRTSKHLYCLGPKELTSEDEPKEDNGDEEDR